MDSRWIALELPAKCRLLAEPGLALYPDARPRSQLTVLTVTPAGPHPGSFALTLAGLAGLFVSRRTRARFVEPLGSATEPTHRHSAGDALFVKLAFPSPVPMVRTAHRRSSLTKGSSLRPCTTASLCIITTVLRPSIVGMFSLSRRGR